MTKRKAKKKPQPIQAEQQSRQDRPGVPRRLRPRPGGLTNEVHPLWAQDRFDSPLDYSIFHRSAQLCTQISQTAQFQHYFYGMFFGTNKASARLPKTSKNKPDYWQPAEYSANKGPMHLTAEDVAAVDGQLRDLAKIIQFRLSNSEIPDAQACTRGEGKGRKSRSHGFPNSECDPVVYIDRSIYRMCLRKHSKGDITNDARFALAVNLLHEVAHCAQEVIAGRKYTEDFLEDGLVAEAGFDLETRLFGRRVYAGRWMLWAPWPTRSGAKCYGLDERFRGKDPDEDLLDDHHPDMRVVFISRAYVAKLFSGSTWAEVGGSAERGQAIVAPFLAGKLKEGEIPAGVPQSVADIFSTHTARFLGNAVAGGGVPAQVAERRLRQPLARPPPGSEEPSGRRKKKKRTHQSKEDSH